MNPHLRDPLLRYASLAGAGLPVGERHMARAAARQRVAPVAPHGDAATRLLAGLSFTAERGGRAPLVIPDGEDNPPAAQNGHAPARRKPHKLILLTY